LKGTLRVEEAEEVIEGAVLEHEHDDVVEAIEGPVVVKDGTVVAQGTVGG
jgi:hypothetical protein